MQGSNAVFIVSATGAPTPSYQWLFNGSALPGATSNTLTITNAQGANIGTYSVLVTNVGGSVPSSAAHLTVLVAPSIPLAGVNFIGNTLSVGINSVLGLNYSLEYKNSLSDTSWTPILPATPGTGGVISLLDPNAGSVPTRFYRVNSF
jgi:hypothetical protein